MGDRVTFEIKGLDVLQRRLERLPYKVAIKVLKVALVRAGTLVLNMMRQLAPKRTGFLSEHFNLRMHTVKENIAASVFIGPEGKMLYPRRGVGLGHKGRTIPVASVARFTELGTSKEKANPFMTQSFETTKDAALQTIIEGVREGISDAEKS